MQSKIIFIRHGESLGNVDPTYYQYPDAANILSAKGVMQALKVADDLPALMPVDHYGNHTQIITSEYQRAKITAQIATSKIKHVLPIISDARLNEVYHSAHEEPDETSTEVRHRVLSLIMQYPFNMVLFCHGMLMRDIDRPRGGAKNCEIRIYDRIDLINELKY